MQEHLDLKDKLLNPKKGDKLTTIFYLEGQRLCYINFGSKWMTVAPVFGTARKKKYSTKKGREILKQMYWNAAATDAFYKALAEGKKKARKGWEKNYA